MSEMTEARICEMMRSAEEMEDLIKLKFRERFDLDPDLRKLLNKEFPDDEEMNITYERDCTDGTVIATLTLNVSIYRGCGEWDNETHTFYYEPKDLIVDVEQIKAEIEAREKVRKEAEEKAKRAAARREREKKARRAQEQEAKERSRLRELAAKYPEEIGK